MKFNLFQQNKGMQDHYKIEGSEIQETHPTIQHQDYLFDENACAIFCLASFSNDLELLVITVGS